jgi:hypothetical protein
MKTLLFLFSLILSGVAVTAQQVVASSGHTATAGGYAVDWTLGEPVIETFTGSNHILTQGMHQTNLVVTDLQYLTLPGPEVKVYPNPAGDFLTIEIARPGNGVFYYSLSDITGRRILLKEMQTLPETADMKSYASGTYLLQVFNSRLEHVKVCKIIKR